MDRRPPIIPKSRCYRRSMADFFHHWGFSRTTSETDNSAVDHGNHKERRRHPLLHNSCSLAVLSLVGTGNRDQFAVINRQWDRIQRHFQSSVVSIGFYVIFISSLTLTPLNRPQWVMQPLLPSSAFWHPYLSLRVRWVIDPIEVICAAETP